MPNAAILAVAALFLVYVALSYNHLTSLRNRVQEAWSQIDVQLKRRFDLIPNLVTATKAYMAHERAVMDDIARARQNVIAAGADIRARATAEASLGSSTRSLLALSEAYPELRASENMLALQEQLSTTENRIAFARQFYNERVMKYNTARRIFPLNLFASVLGFAPAGMFHLDDPRERAIPAIRVDS